MTTITSPIQLHETNRYYVPFTIPQSMRAQYYAIDICEALESPKNRLSRSICDNSNIISKIALWIILGIPAAIGYGISKVIYAVKGEKIENYNFQVNQWDTKLAGNKNDSIARNIVDGMIRNKITASMCPYDLIQELTFKSRRPLLFSFEGVLYNHIADSSLQQNNFFVILSPDSCKEATDFITRHLQSKNIPTNKDIHKYFREIQGENQAFLQACRFIWIPPYTPVDKKLVDYIVTKWQKPVPQLNR